MPAAEAIANALLLFEQRECLVRVAAVRENLRARGEDRSQQGLVMNLSRNPFGTIEQRVPVLAHGRLHLGEENEQRGKGPAVSETAAHLRQLCQPLPRLCCIQRRQLRNGLTRPEIEYPVRQLRIARERITQILTGEHGCAADAQISS